MVDAYMTELHDARGETAEAIALKATLHTTCAAPASASASAPAAPKPAAEPLPTGGAAP